MLYNETEVYFRQPGAARRLRCRVCGALCTVARARRLRLAIDREPSR